MKDLEAEAVRLMICPYCDELPGDVCRKPDGRRHGKAHGARLVALTLSPGYDREEYASFEKLRAVRCERRFRL